MFGQTEAITVDMVRLALDAASMRHLAIANNIANVNSAGYAPASVDFERQMAAARGALRQGEPLQGGMLAGVHPVLRRGAPAGEADRSALLDTEVANMAQNTVQYQALLAALKQHMSILGSAVSEGKR